MLNQLYALKGEEQHFPVYAGSVEESGRVHVARVYWAQNVKVINHVLRVLLSSLIHNTASRIGNLFRNAKIEH